MTFVRLSIAGLLAGMGVACGSAPTPEPAKKQPDPPVEPQPQPALADVEGVTAMPDVNAAADVVEVNLTAAVAMAELEPGFNTSVYAFNGQIPGPLLHARVGDKVVVHFKNDLPEATTIHWHGLRISDQMDGNPRLQAPVEPGASFTYEFVVPDAGTFWYHPHVNTVEQIERGLYGPIVVAEADAPVFDHERVFVLDDVRFTPDYEIAPFSLSGMDAMHGRAGNALLVNGKTQSAKGTVAAGSVERWRLVNSATARTLALTLAGASFRVIGTDGGLLPAPYIPERLELAVGQRYDLEVTFDGSPGSSVTLAANVLAEVSGQVQKVALPLVEYDIQGTVAGAKPVYPPITLPAVDVSAKEQLISLGGHTEGGKLVYTINGASGDDVPMLMLAQNEPVTLRIVNEIGPFHPFHLHGQFFQILTRNGSPTQEPGLKDTVLLDSMEEVTVLSHFENPGEWMYHCHIGQHAELGMMGHVMVSSAH